MKTYILVFFMAIICFCAGYLFKPTPEPIVQWETKVVTKKIYRDYSKIKLDECLAKLYMYDTSDFVIDKQKVNPELYRIEAKLFERTAHRDLKIKCSSSGNWTTYLAVGAVAGIAATMYLK